MLKEIRAFYINDFIRVYQAYNNTIADSAVMHQKFISPHFKIERTTWIKPSFLWMMYRSGWAIKQGQERILAIDIIHEGFLWALGNSCLSHFDSNFYKSYDEWGKIKNDSLVVIQWDPERDLELNKLNYRAIQIGLTPAAVRFYATDWIIKITDITDTVKKIKSLIDEKKMAEALEFLPLEKKYSVPDTIMQKIGMTF